MSAHAPVRAFATGVHGEYLFFVLFKISIAPNSMQSFYLRAVRFVVRPTECEDRSVLFGFPLADSCLVDRVCDGRLVDHVGHPGVPVPMSEQDPPKLQCDNYQPGSICDLDMIVSLSIRYRRIIRTHASNSWSL